MRSENISRSGLLEEEELVIRQVDENEIGLRSSLYKPCLPLNPFCNALNSTEITIMATRILITCKSHTVPGADEDKATLLTNQACQMVFSRDFNETLGDRLVIEGEFSFGVRCSLLVDNGPVDSTDYAISFFRWNGTELYVLKDHGLDAIADIRCSIRHPLPPYAARKLEERYQFNPANRPQIVSYFLSFLVVFS